MLCITVHGSGTVESVLLLLVFSFKRISFVTCNIRLYKLLYRVYISGVQTLQNGCIAPFHCHDWDIIILIITIWTRCVKQSSIILVGRNQWAMTKTIYATLGLCCQCFKNNSLTGLGNCLFNKEADTAFSRFAEQYSIEHDPGYTSMCYSVHFSPFTNTVLCAVNNISRGYTPDPLLVQCWLSVVDAGPTLNQQWLDTYACRLLSFLV